MKREGHGWQGHADGQLKEFTLMRLRCASRSKGNPPETWSPGHRRSHTLHTLFIIYSGGRNYIMKQQSVRQYPCTHTHTHTSSFNSMPVRSIWRRANKMKKNYVLQLSYSHRNIAAKSLNWQKNRVIPQRRTDTQIHKTSQAPERFVNDVCIISEIIIPSTSKTSNNPSAFCSIHTRFQENWETLLPERQFHKLNQQENSLSAFYSSVNHSANWDPITQGPAGATTYARRELKTRIP